VERPHSPPWSSLKNVKQLFLNGSGISAAAVDALRKQIPQARIDF